MKCRSIFSAAVLAFMALPVGMVSAQVVTSPKPETTAPFKEGETPRSTGPGTGGSDSTGSTGNLSERLNRSEGVIAPPRMDSDMVVKAPVPNPGTTPVIRPPGEPGGNPDVQPK